MGINGHASLSENHGVVNPFCCRNGWTQTCPGQIYLAINLTFTSFGGTVRVYWLLITCSRKPISMGIDYTLSSLSSERRGQEVAYHTQLHLDFSLCPSVYQSIYLRTIYPSVHIIYPPIQFFVLIKL